ncbi:hypothetical protein VTN00DRAFT_3897 [Thermoascus crustaceus]|uniref:uncharacterized protein n=1 Tax=Thermoascus crustaceus TaxID=5088 RepID=UPI003743D0D3
MINRIGVPVSGTLTSTAATHASASHVLGSNTEVLSTVDRRAERVQRKPSSHSAGRRVASRTRGGNQPSPLRCQWAGCRSTRTFGRTSDLRRHVEVFHIAPVDHFCHFEGCRYRRLPALGNIDNLLFASQTKKMFVPDTNLLFLFNPENSLPPSLSRIAITVFNITNPRVPSNMVAQSWY